MHKESKVKNILILLFFFLLGFVSNVLLVHWQDIDIYSLFQKIDKETVIEEIDVEENNLVCEQSATEEETEVDLCPVLVDISGAVTSPGVYCFEKGSSVIDAVKRAKGFLPSAGYKYISMKINLATVMLDNSKIYIPFEQDYDCNLLTFSLPKAIVDITIPDTQPNDGDPNTPGTDQGCISINNATQEKLESLDGVGPSTALKIIEGRPYSALEDLLNVSGIGEATFNKFKEKICL